MGFLDFLSPGLTAATNAVGSYEGAQADAAKQKTAQIAQQIAALRQQHNDDIANALKAAQTGALTAVKPKRTPEKFTTGGKPVQGSMDEGGAYYDAGGNPVQDASPFAPEHEGNPLASTKGYVNRDGTLMLGQDGKPIMPPSTVPNNVFTPGVGESGTPTIFTGKSKGDPALTDTGVGKPVTGAGGQGVRAANAAIPELKAAGAIIDRFDDPSLMSQLSKKAGLFGNYMNTPEGRQFNQAITQFVTLSELAKGNKRPTDAMMHRFHEIYAPAPGDDDATRAQKRQARATLIESVSQMGGAAASHQSTTPSTPTAPQGGPHPIVSKYGITPSAP
jgi:hypothetical protein